MKKAKSYILLRTSDIASQPKELLSELILTFISVTQVARLPVSEEKVPWSAEWTDYAPQDFTAPFVQGVGYNIQCLAHSKKYEPDPTSERVG